MGKSNRRLVHIARLGHTLSETPVYLWTVTYRKLDR